MAYFRRPRHAARLRRYFADKADGFNPPPVDAVIAHGAYEELIPSRTDEQRRREYKRRRKHRARRAARRAALAAMPFDSPPLDREPPCDCGEDCKPGYTLCESCLTSEHEADMSPIIVCGQTIHPDPQAGWDGFDELF